MGADVLKADILGVDIFKLEVMALPLIDVRQKHGTMKYVTVIKE